MCNSDCGDAIKTFSTGYMRGPCAEGALKIKEYCGIHSEACLSGEKANLSLVSKNMATLMVISKDKVHHVSHPTPLANAAQSAVHSCLLSANLNQTPITLSGLFSTSKKNSEKQLRLSEGF